LAPPRCSLSPGAPPGPRARGWGGLLRRLRLRLRRQRVDEFER
jgi:hypothetical protein